LFPYMRPQDIADILIMSFLVYQLYSWFRNTKALQVMIGIGFLVLLYLVTKYLDLFMTSWILQELRTVLFILIIVIFQNEIRQALYRFSLLRNMFGSETDSSRIDFMELSSTIFTLAQEKTGVLLVFQRSEPLDEYLLHGVPLDSLVSSQLIATIFRNGTPLHDGAAVVRNDRITQASCHLPLSANADLPQHFGTRHRAGLGLSERTDAAVVIVSEERGEVSLALGGELTTIDTPEHLSERLHSLHIKPDREVVRVSIRKRLFSNLRPKLIVTFLVLVTWLFITARQGGIVTITSPIKFHNLPDDLVMVRNSADEVDVQVKVLSMLIPSPKHIDIVTDIDLSKIKEGTNRLPIRSEDLQLPLGVVVSGIDPSVVKVVAEKKMRKTLKVRVRTVGSLPSGRFLRKVRVIPATITAVGPEHLLSSIDSVATEEVDLSDFLRSTVITTGLMSPDSQVKFIPDETVKIQLVIAGRQP
jgi:diadenylate cyclase